MRNRLLFPVVLLALIAALLVPSSASAITRGRAIAISQAWAWGVCNFGVVGAVCDNPVLVPAHIVGGPYSAPEAQWVTEGAFVVFQAGEKLICDYELVLGNRGRIRHSWSPCTTGTPDIARIRK